MLKNIKNLTVVLMVSVFSLVACAQQSPEDWKQAAVNDITEAHQVLLENHPGTYDPNNPKFPELLDLAKQRGLQYAQQVTDANSYAAALQGFSAVLGDGHTGLTATRSAKGAAPQWPGFVAVWRETGMFVSSSKIDGVAPGAEVIACDSKPIKTLIEENVFAFRGRKNELGQWWALAESVFVDFNNPFVKTPSQCEFWQAGKKIEHQLQWRDMDRSVQPLFNLAHSSGVLDVGITEPSPKLLWVSMPTFTPNEAQRETYFSIVKELAEKPNRFDDSEALVIDLRKNSGGSSTWSFDFAKALWGADAVRQRKFHKSQHQQVWWRASNANTDYVQKDMVDFLKKANQSDVVKGIESVGSGMRSSLKKSEKFYVSSMSDTDKKKGIKKQSEPVAVAYSKPVYVIVPGKCASACADALDVFTLFENTKLIGAPSSGDSPYMEVRRQTTTSGLAQITIPLKVYVNRPRGDGEIYLPDIYVNDLEWSTEKFLTYIERDLAVSKK